MSSNCLKREPSSFMTTHQPTGMTSSISTTHHHFSIPYTIFIYKEELRKGTAEFMRLSKVKLHLTDTLITKTIKNISQYDVAEVININEQMIFKKRLFSKMHKIRKLQKMGLKHIDPNQISDDV